MKSSKQTYAALALSASLANAGAVKSIGNETNIRPADLAESMNC